MALTDPLSEVLRSIELTASFFCRAEFSAPFTVTARQQQRGIFHAILDGPACWLALEDQESEPLRLEPGSVVVLPHGHAHRLSHEPRPCRSVSIESLVANAGNEGLAHLRTGGRGATSRMLCGSVHFERAAHHPLLAGLPPVVMARSSGTHLGEWLEATLRVLDRELVDTLPGTEAVLTRLADILIVQVVRGHLAEGGAVQPGWLAGLRDPAIRRALGAIHAEPASAWTAESLARRAGLSRSAFCERFLRHVGEGPGAYLNRWRMHLAARLLHQEEASVAEAAERVGYRSESAFSQAFLRAFGVRPAEHRRQAQRNAQYEDS